MIHICDNFFKDPYNIRSIALNQKYECGDYWPGFRERYVVEQKNASAGRNLNLYPLRMNNVALEYVLPSIQRLTKNPNLMIDTSSFQYVTADYGEGAFHSDSPNLYTCIIFLSPNPPNYSGTEICDNHPDSENGYLSQKYWNDMRSSKGLFYKDTGNRLNRYRYDRLRKKFMDKLP